MGIRRNKDALWINGVHLLPDGRILSWSDDVICIWSLSANDEPQYRLSQLVKGLTVASLNRARLQANDLQISGCVILSKSDHESGPVCWTHDSPNPCGLFWEPGGRLVAKTADNQLVWLQLIVRATLFNSFSQAPSVEASAGGLPHRTILAKA